MQVLLKEIDVGIAPNTLANNIRQQRGLVLLRSNLFDGHQARYSFLTARPFLEFRSWSWRCEQTTGGITQIHFGNPWELLDELMSRFELLEQLDLPFPIGGCFGYWGYDLKNFVEPKLPRRAENDLGLPDCHLGFYDSLVAVDHYLNKAWIVSTGLQADGSRTHSRAHNQMVFWQSCFARLEQNLKGTPYDPRIEASSRTRFQSCSASPPLEEGTEASRPFPEQHPHFLSNFEAGSAGFGLSCNFSRAQFLKSVERIKEYIHAGDVYQVNLSQRFAALLDLSAWDLFQYLSEVSPAPFSAYMDCGDFQLVSSSPELFLRLSGGHVETRPIKGTRSRSPNPLRDSQLGFELQTSSKEMAELIMITDLLRNDLGKFCEFGSVHVPELMRLERYAHVQHLVSTVEGRLPADLSHLRALQSCFPGGSITGAPKHRAMEIIDELEPVSRGPYTGAVGYLGFNRESQLSIIIRTAICTSGRAYFQTGAGIVADSNAEAEYAETLDKARGFFEALQFSANSKVMH